MDRKRRRNRHFHTNGRDFGSARSLDKLAAVVAVAAVAAVVAVVIAAIVVSRVLSLIV